MVASVGAGTALIIITSLIGIAFAAFQMMLVSKVTIQDGPSSKPDDMESKSDESLVASDGKKNALVEMTRIYKLIQAGAKAFLFAEYTLCAVFIVLFGALVLVATSHKNKDDTVDGKSWDFKFGGLTAFSFVVGSVTSIVSGYIGMMVAVYSNVRTTKSAMNAKTGWTDSFNTAFRAGGVMGFSLCGLALLVLFCVIQVCKAVFSDVDLDGTDVDTLSKKNQAYRDLFECVAGFGLGGSSIAMFGRVGGGIYTKAADVGADLAGKVVHGIPEDDPRNPAVIADNVGDNVGDVAGMGSDLFGSFGEATCAALVVASQTPDLVAEGFATVLFPLYISAVGIVVCMLTSFVATNVSPVRKDADVEKVLKVQLGVSTLLMTAVMYPVCSAFLPESAGFSCPHLYDDASCAMNVDSLRSKAFLCVCMGLWGGCLIGFITEYYTSHSYAPTREVAASTSTGAATNIIMGLALGYQSAAIPATIIAACVFVSFKYLGMFGISLAALGMLSTLATCLSIDVFGPVCDNAGGIAEMAGCHESVRAKTDSLDAAGNTTAAIGKGFAIGSAALVSLALFGAFSTKVGWLETYGVNMLRPVTFSFLIIGAMLPYIFTALTMKSVGKAAAAMVEEVQRQFTENPDLLDASKGLKPDYATCIDISTKASLREMILPGMLVMLSPILTGVLFGVEAVCGLLSGALVSSVQMAISQSNTGGAWDNAKKYIEKGELKIVGNNGNEYVAKKGSEEHKAAVVGDTVGDPLKDTSGPALNIVMKLMAIISLVFSGFFLSINHGEGLLKIESWKDVVTGRTA
jgi:H+-translocating diphosphatase